MDEGHVIPEAIRALLEQRGTYQGWLSRLDELGSEFRPEVAEKVRTDYAGRLAEVESELSGHRSELETALAERADAVQKVAVEHDARSAELEETQLRHVVGEFDDDEWERRRSEHQSGIDELETTLAKQRLAVDSLQTVLGELTGAAAVVEAAEAVAEAEPPIPDELVATEDEWSEPEPAEETEAWTEPEPEEVAAVANDVVQAEVLDPEIAERDFEHAELVEAEVVLEETAEELETEEGEAESDQAEPEEFMDELEFLESLSLDDADNFDAVSAMLEDDGDSDADGESKGKTEDL